ncbi:MAG: hypothetical protein AUG00_10640 [Candidatus Rokubacteria bacterium 13_1_20CM_2_70_7]|nr:MAG: hypothetical protein AUG00_10640 [Candidatus Rokubacteria bacterium 13_1_20CM_2_70_7]
MMFRRISLTACTLVLGLTLAAGADEVITGTVVRVDEHAGVIVLDDARMYRVADGGAVLVNSQAMELREIEPGTRVVIPAASPATTVVTPPPAPITLTEGAITGTVSSVDEPASVVVLSDGRMVQIGPKTIILADGRPIHLAALKPGAKVIISAVNPVVYRNGRYALLNSGFRDSGTGSSLTWDSQWAGYEVEIEHGGMQIQS